jgi:DNA polymerase I-like protein with 3'-5' exonuclease and polymerase domains
VISVDTETTGLDLRHGARPFFVTTCDEDSQVSYWHWEVNPLTREVSVPQEDIQEIRELILTAPCLVLQNAKFDVAALVSVGVIGPEEWPWHNTVDTLLAAHLLASNRPKSLDKLAAQYLGANIEPLEEHLHDACERARRICRSRFPAWRIARKGDPSMPSAKEKCWKHDTWLPGQLAKRMEYDPGHNWHGVLQRYANADSAVTVQLWPVMRDEIHRRGLWKIYQQRLKILPIAYAVERDGVTVSKPRLTRLLSDYREKSKVAAEVCVAIARDRGTELKMPRGGNSKALTEFVFGKSGLSLPVVKRTDSGAPCFDQHVLAHYLETLRPNSPAHVFIHSLARKRKRDKHTEALESYQRFWRPWSTNGDNPDWYRLHPFLNPTGTVTVRWSSSNPNEQNISTQEDDSGLSLRYCFGPAPGREWWSLDAKNLELRIPAYECEEEDFIALFERPDDPPYFGSNHLLIAHVLHPKLFEACVATEGELKGEVDGRVFKKRHLQVYKCVKNGNFAVTYGAIDRADGKGTADRAYGMPGAHARIKQRFRKMEALNQKWIRYAEKHGRVETMPDRSVDPSKGYPLLCTYTEHGKLLPTVPLNYHVQGTACWWMQQAMIRVQEYLDTLNRASRKAHEAAHLRRGTAPPWSLTRDGYFITMQIHDELVLDFPQRISGISPIQSGPPAHLRQSGEGVKVYGNLAHIKEIQRLMECGGDDIGVPTPTSCEYHSESWKEGISL